MLKKWKCLTALFLTLAVILSGCGPASNGADGDLSAQQEYTEVQEEETREEISGVTSGGPAFVRPLYLEVFAKEEVALDEGTLALPEEAYFTSLADAGAYLREQMKARKETIMVCYRAGEYNPSQIQDIVAEAEKHTGVPDEGDYLAFQIGGYAAAGDYSVRGLGHYWTLTYEMKYYTSAEQEAEVDEALADVLESLHLEGDGAYEKVCAVYDWICANVTYDYGDPDDPAYEQKCTAYAALINGTAVCQGYAALLYRMLLEAGVDNRILSGTAGDGGHAWNIVGLDGLYYNVDVTWDAEEGSRRYFLKGDRDFSDHVRGEDYLTEAFYQSYPMGETE